MVIEFLKAFIAGAILALLASAIIWFTWLDDALPAEPWTRGDTYREVVAFAVRGVDWKTTRDIARRPREYREVNPLLGEHPSVGKVDAYFLATSIIHPVVSYYLPGEYRRAFQYISIGISGSAGLTNLWSGLRVRF